jgi:hypothetical protein
MHKRHLLFVAAAAVAGCSRPLPPPAQVEVTNVTALRKDLGGGVSEATAAAAPAAEPTGWATIRGTFKLVGTPPEPALLNVDKDQTVCAPGGKRVVSEKLVVDSATQGIRDVVIYLTSKFKSGDPKWEHPDLLAQREGIVEFDQKNCIFLSHMFAMRSTQKLKILNSDPVGHNTNFPGFNQLIAANGYAMYQPSGELPEPASVACNIHPWMSALMLFRNSPYYAVTKADGSFEIPNVPAGVPLEFRVWHESAKFLQDVNRAGKAEKWPKGRLKLTLQPDQQESLEVTVDVAAFTK